jgi:hypothetical protein
MNQDIDLLQIKIDKARAELSEESRRAIDAVDWKTTILGMRAEKGFSYEQLESLELETELVLCGLLDPEDYSKELEKRMGIQKPQADELVNEMNEKIFKKIREELVKNIERGKIQKESTEQPLKNPVRIVSIKEKPTETPDLLAEKELPAPSAEEKIPSILTQKFSGSFQIPKVETDHSLNNMTKGSGEEKTGLPKVDPYRMPIE